MNKSRRVREAETSLCLSFAPVVLREVAQASLDRRLPADHAALVAVRYCYCEHGNNDDGGGGVVRYGYDDVVVVVDIRVQ